MHLQENPNTIISFPNYPHPLSVSTISAASMDHRPSNTTSARRSLKRKLEQEFEEHEQDQESDCKIAFVEIDNSHQDLIREVRARVQILESTFSSSEADRASAKRATHALSELAKDGIELNVDAITIYLLIHCVFLRFLCDSVCELA